MAKQITWIPEPAAAERFGYKPETLRRLVKRGVLNISFTTVRGRRFQYSQADIERELLKSARLIHLQ